MLYFLSELSDGGDAFNLFRYITFRSGGAFFTALILSFIFGAPLIRRLKKMQKHGQPIREDGPTSHIIQKAGTPTMGGVLILGTLLFSSLLWARSDNGYVWIVLLVTVGFCVIGFIDDYLKVTKNNVIGFSSKARIILGLLISLIAVYWAQTLHSEDFKQTFSLANFQRYAFEFRSYLLSICNNCYRWCSKCCKFNGWAGWAGNYACHNSCWNTWCDCICSWAY